MPTFLAHILRPAVYPVFLILAVLALFGIFYLAVPYIAKAVMFGSYWIVRLYRRAKLWPPQFIYWTEDALQQISSQRLARICSALLLGILVAAGIRPSVHRAADPVADYIYSVTVPDAVAATCIEGRPVRLIQTETQLFFRGQGARVRLTPSSHANVTVLHYGDSITAVGETTTDRDWLQVRTNDGKYGYISKKLLPDAADLAFYDAGSNACP